MVSKDCDVELRSLFMVLVVEILDTNRLYRGVAYCAGKIVGSVNVFDWEWFY